MNSHKKRSFSCSASCLLAGMFLFSQTAMSFPGPPIPGPRPPSPKHPAPRPPIRRVTPPIPIPVPVPVPVGKKPYQYKESKGEKYSKEGGGGKYYKESKGGKYYKEGKGEKYYKGERYYKGEKYYRTRPYYPVPVFPLIPYGTIYTRIPVGHSMLYVGGAAFYFHMGTYYQRRHSSYVVVEAPIGATISTLPENRYSTVTIDGITYYTLNGAYYLRDASGYMVVPAPVKISPPSQPASSGKVYITSQVLNVRSGPGTNHPVIGQLYKGNKLAIIGNAVGWYYIQLPDGKFGWIMSRYTAPVVSQQADG